MCQKHAMNDIIEINVIVMGADVHPFLDKFNS